MISFGVIDGKGTITLTDLEPVSRAQPYYSLSGRNKAQSLVDEGICLDLNDAYHFLLDCGEWEDE